MATFSTLLVKPAGMSLANLLAMIAKGRMGCTVNLLESRVRVKVRARSLLVVEMGREYEPRTLKRTMHLRDMAESYEGC